MESAEAYIGLLIQVPLVGIFIFFTLRIITIFLDTLRQRDVSWQEFLQEQRETSNAATVRLAEEIKEINKSIAALNVSFQNHDQIMRDGITSMRVRVNTGPLRSRND